jgi:hypothetical protein
MASKDRKARCLGAGLLLLALFLDSNRLIGQVRESLDPVESVASPEETLRVMEWTIMDRLARAYGSTKWSAVAVFLGSNAGYEGNPNIVFIPLSLGNVFVNRYEWRNDTADFERALEWFEWVAQSHWVWGHRWLAAPVVSYLDISLVRLRAACAPEGFADRIEAAWRTALALTGEEADARLTDEYPYRPYDSSATGDSKAEENAWEAGLLAAAANFLPEHPHASVWEEKARQLAYDAITRSSDPPDPMGVKTSTVADDFTLSNHGFFPNPTYSAATIELLLQAALAYHLTGRDVPPEFGHNVSGLYEAYRSYVDEDLQWIVPSDPSGEAALFPFAFDPEFEERLVRRGSANGYLWQATEPVAVMEVGVPLYTAVLNSKAVMFHLMGSYLWHFPPQCEVLESMP